MSKSRRLSNASAACLSPLEAAGCTVEWRPSPLVGAILWALALLAPCCLLASGLPPAWSWPLAGLVAIAGIRDARRYRRRPTLLLAIPAGPGDVACNGVRVQVLELRWRGPLAFLRWREDGRARCLAFWPDLLAAPARRELRLAMQRRETAAPAASVAP